MSAIEVRVPDIGDFKDVPVIDVLVKPGDTVGVDDSLITLESDKATMDVPAPSAGTIMPTTCHSITHAAALNGWPQKSIAIGVAVISRFIKP